MKNSTRNILQWAALPALAILLFFLSLVFDNRYLQRVNLSKEKTALESYIHKNENGFQSFLKDTSLINRIINDSEDISRLNALTKKEFGVYLYRDDVEDSANMVFWNNQLATPPDTIVNGSDTTRFLQLYNGSYISIKQSVLLNGITGPLKAICLIPVRFDYFVETDYLPRRFAYSDVAEAKIAISTDATDFAIKDASGKTLFYINKKQGGVINANVNLVIWLRLTALALIFIFIHFLSDAIVKKNGALAGLFFLFSAILGLRVISYFFAFPFDRSGMELFDPEIYGADKINRSLGDLLINTLLYCWFVAFAWSKSGNRDNLLSKLGKITQIIVRVVSPVLLVAFSFLMARLVKSFIADSPISFNVTDFSSINRYSIIGFIILACLSLTYYYTTRILYSFIRTLFPAMPYLKYIIIAIAGLVYLSFQINNPILKFYLPVLGWVMIYIWVLGIKKAFFNSYHISISAVLFWITFFSFSISVVIVNENAIKEWQLRKIMAQKLADQADPTNERVLSIALTYIDDDFLNENHQRFFKENENQFLRDSILKQSGYLSQFATRLYVFDTTGKALYNEDPESLNVLNTIFKLQAKPTSTPGFFYYETGVDRYTYIVKREIKDDNNIKVGTFFIVANPRKYSTDALFAELFKKSSRNDPGGSPIYSYVIYKDYKLTTTNNKYPFPISLNEKDGLTKEFSSVMNGYYNELWYRAGKGKVVVIAKKKDSFIEATTLFSWIFCAFIITVGFMRLTMLLMQFGFRRKDLKNLFQLNIRTQVHGIVIFVSLISFIVIGIATISFFFTRFDRNNSDKLSRTMSIMLNEMQKKMKERVLFGDEIKVYDSVSNSRLKNLVDEISEIHGVDINVYDTAGTLQVSSQPLVYNEGFLSRKINPEAFYHLSRFRKVQHIQEEKMGNLSYVSIYSPVRNEGGKVEAYVNIPYFQSQQELNQEISNFLVTIINLNTFIFLIAGVIALFVTNRITRSFAIISEKMKEVNLGKTNDPIEWKRNDEIGGLVKEYNTMVNKLGESAAALAKSEREGAWREMARQVAHEIKNPLTPMKLSIQYLQKSIDNNQPNVKELSTNVAKTLIEQIDHLSKIAADFSQFANIGNIQLEYFDLHDVVKSLTELYKSNKKVDVYWNPVGAPAIIYADKTQMNRLFTNLFQNAVEASEDKGKSVLHIHEWQQNGSIRVSVHDNGDGIDEKMQEKIFMPNFTTKSSGTGLGLAMCKGIAEQAHGKIWFKTIQGVGSTFFVELPLVN